MYGDMQNVSAQIIENMHLKVKDAAARSNGQDGWELHAMVRNMRESALQLKTSSANMSVARTGANATFRNGAALRYPVWKVILILRSVPDTWRYQQCAS